MTHEALAPSRRATVGVPTLAALVVGSMVGAGVFSLPARFASETGLVGTLVAWAVAGTGMLMLALVFQRLAVHRPDLDAGIYSYARAGFGQYPGMLAAVGYWLSACAGNAFYWILIMSTLGALVPGMGDGATPLALATSSACLWGFYLLVRRGVREASGINRVVTVAKLVPILVFVVLAAVLLDPAVLAGNLAAGAAGGDLVTQVRGTVLATVFVFLGIEGASVYSRHARRREDVGRATLLGFLGVLAVFASVTVVSFGVLPAEEIARLRAPSMAGVLEAAVGPWGAWLVSVGLVVAVLGAYLAWTLMAAEVLHVAARAGDLPRALARTNAGDAPGPALLVSAATAQAILLLAGLTTDALDFALDLTAALSLIPFALAAGYGLRSATAGTRRWDVVVAAVATLYTVFLVWAAGLGFLLLSMLVYAPATLLLVRARAEHGRPLLGRRDLPVLVVVTAGAVAALVALATGGLAL